MRTSWIGWMLAGLAATGPSTAGTPLPTGLRLTEFANGFSGLTGIYAPSDEHRVDRQRRTFLIFVAAAQGLRP